MLVFVLSHMLNSHPVLLLAC